MTAIFPMGSNDRLFASPADWVSPANSDATDSGKDLSALSGKVILNDTDHIWGIGGDPQWVWESLCRGLNPIYMDIYTASLIQKYPMYRPGAQPTDQERRVRSDAERVRNNLGFARVFAERMNLRTAVPHGDLVSTGYCLGDSGLQYLVFLPADAYGLAMLRHGIRRGHFNERVTVDLSKQSSEFSVDWFRVATGELIPSGQVRGGSKVEFEAPFYGDAVLFLLAQRQSRNVDDIAHIGHRNSLPTEELVLLSEQIRLHHGT
jgi:hypothetical protein